jgi:hypothetical protein
MLNIIDRCARFEPCVRLMSAGINGGPMVGLRVLRLLELREHGVSGQVLSEGLAGSRLVQFDQRQRQYVDGWRVSAVCNRKQHSAVDSPVTYDDHPRFSLQFEPRPISFVSGGGSSFGVVSRLLSEVGSGPGGCERQKPDGRSNIAERPSGVGGAASGVGRLPLSAKIGLTLVAAILAWLLQLRGFILAVQGGRYILKGGSYIVAGTALWFSSALLW